MSVHGLIAWLMWSWLKIIYDSGELVGLVVCRIVAWLIIGEDRLFIAHRFRRLWALRLVLTLLVVIGLLLT